MDRSSETYKEFLETVLEQVDGTIVTDSEGIIIYLNIKYAEMLGVDPLMAIGKHAREIIPQTRMDIVAKTGQAEIGSVHMINGVTPVVCNRIPLIKDGKSIGAVAFTTFRKLDEVAGLFSEINRLNLELKEYKSELIKLRETKYTLDQIVGSSSQLNQVKEIIKKVAPSKLTVLISGETGTGKELFAQAIHQLSPRKYKPFIRINCAAIPKDLLESELFGYEEGAFSGAKKGGKPGKFEMANGGTLLLDEINELPIYLQSKLLRIIQEQEIERVGGVKTIKLDVRLVCTTNRNMPELVANGDFREDLFYRINVVEVAIPALRERYTDIRELAEHFVKKINANHGLGISGINEDILQLFAEYKWPGNIRELEHVMERAAVMAISGELSAPHFDYLMPRLLSDADAETRKTAGLERVKSTAEKQAILNALAKAGGNKTLAARELNIHRTVLYTKLKKYGIV